MPSAGDDLAIVMIAVVTPTRSAAARERDREQRGTGAVHVATHPDVSLH
ncbi:hypothetical protein [Rhodococcus sp. NPDC055024]